GTHLRLRPANNTVYNDVAHGSFSAKSPRQMRPRRIDNPRSCKFRCRSSIKLSHIFAASERHSSIRFSMATQVLHGR
ncbi:hypothetical protein L9F63_027690, partial [Diploptera punctata]